MKSGDMFDVTGAAVLDARVGAIECPEIAKPSDRIRVVVGPQEAHFQDGALDRFLSEPYQLSDAFDRMGVRLTGPELALGDVLSIPSEPVVRGSVQVSGEQVPTVLLADHQTTGGYPKIATVLSCDLDQLVQKRARSEVRFEAVSAEEAIAAARAYRQKVDAAFEEISKPRLTLSERLMQENIVGGVVGFDD